MLARKLCSDKKDRKNFFFEKKKEKLCEFGFGLSWRIEAEIIKSFLLLFFKKEVLSCLSVCLAPWYHPHPCPPPERGSEILGSYLLSSDKTCCLSAN
jgi:hypothetical protein